MDFLLPTTIKGGGNRQFHWARKGASHAGSTSPKDKPEQSLPSAHSGILKLTGRTVAPVFLFLLLASTAHAYTTDQLASAIDKAENSKSHPYGIMLKFKHTSPRQACINTINHQHRLWVRTSQRVPFLTFLAHAYAPLGCENDPNNLNKNWERNVTYFLNKEALNDKE